jgi:hypothetical protein
VLEPRQLAVDGRLGRLGLQPMRLLPNFIEGELKLTTKMGLTLCFTDDEVGFITSDRPAFLFDGRDMRSSFGIRLTDDRTHDAHYADLPRAGFVGE